MALVAWYERRTMEDLQQQSLIVKIVGALAPPNALNTFSDLKLANRHRRSPIILPPSSMQLNTVASSNNTVSTIPTLLKFSPVLTRLRSHISPLFLFSHPSLCIIILVTILTIISPCLTRPTEAWSLWQHSPR
jgi:hypothetical protein